MTAVLILGHKCSEKVWDNSAFFAGPCPNKGVLQEDGKWWCRRHAPSAKRAKKQARDARREAKWAAQDAAVAWQERIDDAEAAVLKAAVAWVNCDGVGIAGRLVKAVAKLRDARKAAEKGTAG